MGYLFYPVLLVVVGVVVGLASSLFSIPLWLLLVPFLSLLRPPYAAIGGGALGLGVDIFSGHPFGVMMLLLILIAIVLRQARRHLEDAPLLLALFGGIAAITALAGLLLSRVIVLSIELLPFSLLNLAQPLFSFRIFLALACSMAAVFVASGLIRRGGFLYD